jgi:hypothetical protein
MGSWCNEHWTGFYLPDGGSAAERRVLPQLDFRFQLGLPDFHMVGCSEAVCCCWDLEGTQPLLTIISKEEKYAKPLQPEAAFLFPILGGALNPFNFLLVPQLIAAGLPTLDSLSRTWYTGKGFP